MNSATINTVLKHRAKVKQSANPYALPPSVELFGQRDKLRKARQEEKESLKKMSIFQRNGLLKSPYPVFTQFAHDPQPSTVRSPRESPRPQEKSIQMREFLHQKRQIYMIQLLIDRKNKEIDNLLGKQAAGEKEAVEIDRKVSERTTEMKLQTAKIESQLANAKKEAERSTRKRVELTKEFKIKTNFIALLRSEIDKNEDTLERYRLYHTFLAALTPEGEKPGEYFKNPQQLLDILSNAEEQNLFSIWNSKEAQRSVKDSPELIAIEEELQKLERRKEAVTSVEEEEYNNEERFDDNELTKLSKAIVNCYLSCFKVPADLSPLNMLEKIEIELEKMYRLEQDIDTEFLLEKQAVKDVQRRDEMRKQKQIEQEKKQNIKMQLAIERAYRPVKKREGRPILPRSKPIQVKVHDDERTKRRLLQQQKLNEYLYGPITD